MIESDRRCQECRFMTNPPKGVQCWFHPDDCTILVGVADESDTMDEEGERK